MVVGCHVFLIFSPLFMLGGVVSHIGWRSTTTVQATYRQAAGDTTKSQNPTRSHTRMPPSKKTPHSVLLSSARKKDSESKY